MKFIEFLYFIPFSLSWNSHVSTLWDLLIQISRDGLVMVAGSTYDVSLTGCVEQILPHSLAQLTVCLTVPAEESEGLGGRELREDGSMVQDTAWRERDSWCSG